VHDVVLQQRLEVLAAVLAEEEGVDPRAELLKRKVGGREEGTTVVGGAVEFREEAGLTEAEQEGGEILGSEVEDSESGWGWDNEGREAVNDAVGAKLRVVSLYDFVAMRKTLRC